MQLNKNNQKIQWDTTKNLHSEKNLIVIQQLNELNSAA